MTDQVGGGPGCLKAPKASTGCLGKRSWRYLLRRSLKSLEQVLNQIPSYAQPNCVERACMWARGGGGAVMIAFYRGLRRKYSSLLLSDTIFRLFIHPLRYFLLVY